MWLVDRFFQQFGEFTTFLTDDDITTLCSLTKPKPEVSKILNLLIRFMKAYADRSKEQLRVCYSSLIDVVAF